MLHTCICVYIIYLYIYMFILYMYKYIYKINLYCLRGTHHFVPLTSTRIMQHDFCIKVNLLLLFKFESIIINIFLIEKF